MDNKSAFPVNRYDDNVRKVIPFYDVIYKQIFEMIQIYFENKPLSILDTGCGTGFFGLNAFEELNVSKLVLCDPSEKMIADAKKKIEGLPCEFHCIGSENLSYEEEFDVITAIQSHHYFDITKRERAVENCYKALKPSGMFICFENTAPNSEIGKDFLLKHLESFQIQAGRTYEDVKSHSARYNREFFPITINEHLELLSRVGFKVFELFWHSYMQSGFFFFFY